MYYTVYTVYTKYTYKMCLPAECNFLLSMIQSIIINVLQCICIYVGLFLVVLTTQSTLNYNFQLTNSAY